MFVSFDINFKSIFLYICFILSVTVFVPQYLKTAQAVLVIIGGTNVMMGQMSYVIIGGTNVGVGQMSGGTNVGRTNVGGTCVGRTKVAPLI